MRTLAVRLWLGSHKGACVVHHELVRGPDSLLNYAYVDVCLCRPKDSPQAAVPKNHAYGHCTDTSSVRESSQGYLT